MELLTVILSLLVITHCKKDEITPPLIKTNAISEITQTTGISGGEVINEGGAPVLSKGICWSQNKQPTVSDSKTLDGSGVENFKSLLTGLSANTIYFIRAYATNTLGTGYGASISFTTLPPTAPILTTSNIENITRITATSGGTITSDGAESITGKGICWSINQNPTISDNKTSDGIGSENFTSSLVGLDGNTTYFVRAYATNKTGTGYGNQVSFTTSPVLPTLTTLTVSSITSSSCYTGGIIIADGGSPVTVKGICWSTIANPTTANSKTTDGPGLQSFISSVIGLAPNTTYYLMAYATNSVGTGYGNQFILTTLANGQISDIDGNIYNTVAIGTQLWMKENLRTTKYRNGDLIGTTNPATLVIRFESSPKYQWAFNDSNVGTYGRLYTWYVVSDGRGICPTNWHVPTNAEWTILVDYLANNNYGFQGNPEYLGKSLAATSGWITASAVDAEDIGNDQANNNNSGFTALPGGWRDDGGIFMDLGNIGFWWAYGQGSNPLAATFKLLSSLGGAYRSSLPPNQGLSIRCVKD